MKKILLALGLLACALECHASTNLSEVEFPNLLKTGISFDIKDASEASVGSLEVAFLKGGAEIIGIPGNASYEQWVKALPRATRINTLKKISSQVKSQNNLVEIVRDSVFLSSNLDLCRKFVLEELNIIADILGGLAPDIKQKYDVRISGKWHIFGLESEEEKKVISEYRESALIAFIKSQR